MAEDNFKVKDLSQTKTPKWKQYAAITLGKTDAFSLLKYELILLFCNGLPGAAGLLLRSKLYPSLLGEVGDNVVFGRNLTLRHPHKIRIGSNVIIDDNCVLDAKGAESSKIDIGEGVFIGRNTSVFCKKGGEIEIQARTNIGANCQIFSENKLSIGKGTLVAAYSYLMSGGTYEHCAETPLASQNGYSKGPTTVGSNCWLGAKSVVLDGVSIGDNVTIGAGAVVAKDIPQGAIAVGLPAKVKQYKRAQTEENAVAQPS